MWIRGTDDLKDDEGSVSRLGGGRKAVPSSTWANIKVDSLFRTYVMVIAFSSVYGLEINLPVHPPTAVEAPTNGVLSAVGGCGGGGGMVLGAGSLGDIPELA